jgi:hypothetical protein
MPETILFVMKLAFPPELTPYKPPLPVSVTVSPRFAPAQTSVSEARNRRE